MNCDRCGAWSEVLATRTPDSGLQIKRRRRCANGHTFSTREVFEAVFCSAKQRQAVFEKTATARAELHKRNARIVSELQKGRRGKDIAAELGVSEDTVSLVKKKAFHAAKC